MTALIIERRKKSLYLHWQDLNIFNQKIISSRVYAESLQPYETKEDDLLILRDILDKQIVDANGAKVVRVNDIKLEGYNNDAVLIAVDVGMRGILRRLGVERGGEDIAKLFKKSLPHTLISWDYLPCLAVAANASNKLGRTTEYEAYMARYQQLNPDDPATLFNQAVEHLKAMDDEKARPFLEQCLAADPAFPKCLFEYGMLLLRTGDLAGAKGQLERYLEVAPDGDDAATAQETIKYL